MLSSAEDYYHARQALALGMLRKARKSWSQIDDAAITASWAALIVDLTSIMTLVQLQAAVDGAAYVDAVLTELEIDAPIVDNRRLVPSAFAGVTASGNSLAAMLDAPRIDVLTELKGGAKLADALLTGRKSLDRMVVTEIQDAGRVAVGTSIAARPEVSGYIRMLNPPSCSRCVLLAGKFYRWNSGFRRHPRCDCFHSPVSRGGGNLATPLSPEFIDQPKVTDPMAYFKALSVEEQDRVFTKAGAQAVRDGADISQVVNVRQGMDTAGGLRTTTQGTSKAALAGQRLREAIGSNRFVRLMPESIYQIAGNDRQAVLDLLYRHGYIL